MVIDDCDSKQSVYVYGCKESVLQIQGNFTRLMKIFFLLPVLKAMRCSFLFEQSAGKVNNITIDKCTKMGVVFTVSIIIYEK